jgi:hypothetical protein
LIGLGLNKKSGLAGNGEKSNAKKHELARERSGTKFPSLLTNNRFARKQNKPKP